MAVILVEKGKKEVLTAPTIQAELSSTICDYWHGLTKQEAK